MELLKFIDERFPVEISNVFLIYPDVLTITSTIPQYEGFEIEGCMITVLPIMEDKSIGRGHTVTGYLCNGVPKVYDSNNFTYNFNWLTLENLSEFKQEIKLRYFTSAVDLDISKIMYYIKVSAKNYVSTYLNISVNDLCVES